MGSTATSTASLANLRPFKAGPDPRRYVGGPLSPAEREFRKALDEKHIPKATQLLERVFEMGMDGDAKMAELFFKVCGLIRKPQDAAEIQEKAKALLDAMIVEARARQQPQPVIDLGTASERSERGEGEVATEPGK